MKQVYFRDQRIKRYSQISWLYMMMKICDTSTGLKSHHAEESHITQWKCKMEESHITRREVASFCDNPNGTAASNRKPKSNQI